MTIRETCPDTNLDTKLLELYTISSSLILDNADSWLEVIADVPEELATRVGALAAR